MEARDRPEIGLAESGVHVGGPDFAERLERLAHKFVEIEQRYANRLVQSEVFQVDKYLHGRFAIVGHLRMGPSYACYASVYLRSTQVDHTSVVGFDDRVLAKLGNAKRWDEHVVLLPVTQVIEVGKAHIPAGLEVVVRFDPVYEKVYDLSQGLTFESLGNGSFYSLRIGANRESFLPSIWVPRPHECPSGDFVNRLNRLADFGLREWNRL